MSPLSLPLLVAEAYRGMVLGIADPGSVQPPGTDGVSTLLSYMKWGGTITAIVGLLTVGYKFTLGGDRHSQDGVGMLAKVAGGMLIFGAAFGVVAAVMGG